MIAIGARALLGGGSFFFLLSHFPSLFSSTSAPRHGAPSVDAIFLRFLASLTSFCPFDCSLDERPGLFDFLLTPSLPFTPFLFYFLSVAWLAALLLRHRRFSPLARVSITLAPNLKRYSTVAASFIIFFSSLFQHSLLPYCDSLLGRSPLTRGERLLFLFLVSPQVPLLRTVACRFDLELS